tara:strand:+ start:594 stop:1373 length:780 start_codon:yes stop_codon:yes gene_type:complete
MDFRTNKNGKKYPVNARDKDKNRLNLDPEKLDNLVDEITAVYMKENREKILNDPRKARPQYMREDPTTPLIREVPFGPDTRAIENMEHTNIEDYPFEVEISGGRTNYDHINHSMSEFDKFQAEQDKLPEKERFPMHKKGFRIIHHGGISIPKEQERIVRPYDKRNYEHGKLKARSERTQQKDKDAKEIAQELLLNEGRSKFVNKATGKIRPNKPVRSDYASIISAEKGFNGIIKKETTFKVAEHNKPEFVSVVPLKKKT